MRNDGKPTSEIPMGALEPWLLDCSTEIPRRSQKVFGVGRAFEILSNNTKGFNLTELRWLCRFSVSESTLGQTESHASGNNPSAA